MSVKGDPCSVLAHSERVKLRLHEMTVKRRPQNAPYAKCCYIPFCKPDEVSWWWFPDFLSTQTNLWLQSSPTLQHSLKCKMTWIGTNLAWKGHFFLETRTWGWGGEQNLCQDSPCYTHFYDTHSNAGAKPSVGRLLSFLELPFGVSISL